jgi:hypothetical protein
LFVALPALAKELKFGDVHGNLDTTLSWGSSYRLEGRDPSIIGVQNGGEAYSINGDNGNLNWDPGNFYSNAFKLTQELQLSRDRWGLFARGYYFRDLQYEDFDWVDTPRRTPISDAARSEVGEEAKLLDAYLSGDFDIGERYLNLKLGNQVINWGESTFIQNGINSMNTVDVSKLRIAGSELRDAFEAIPLVQASLAVNARFSFDAFVPFQWKHSEIEPEGTMFSTNDFASPGGDTVYLGFGMPPISDDVPGANAGLSPVGVEVPRAADRDASDGGEFGIAVRWFEPKLNDAEIGFYFTNLHSRLPLISGWTGLRQGFVDGDYAATANYFREFPEDIKTYGVSINTELPRIPLLAPTGMALQAEASYRQDQPLQADDVELLFAALSPLDPFVGWGAAGEGFKLSQLAGGTSFGFDEYVRGWRHKDVIQGQFSTTSLFGPNFGADQWVVITELGAVYVQDMESKDELRYEGPGTYTSANSFFSEVPVPATGRPAQPFTETDGFADEFSWGYRAVLRAQLNDFLGPINLTPTLVWYHDVNGTSPTPILNFVHGRKSFTALLAADYLASWTFSLSYTGSLGGERYNLIRDRDFLSASVGYSF